MESAGGSRLGPLSPGITGMSMGRQKRSGPERSVRGMFMIDGFINDWYPWLNGAQERILVLKDIDLPGAAGRLFRRRRPSTASRTRRFRHYASAAAGVADRERRRRCLLRPRGRGPGVLDPVAGRQSDSSGLYKDDRTSGCRPVRGCTVFVSPAKLGQDPAGSAAPSHTGPQGDPNPAGAAGHYCRGTTRRSRPAKRSDSR